MKQEYQIGIIRLGYVGLPVALAFAKHFKTIGFDINSKKIESLKSFQDPTHEGFEEEIQKSKLLVTDRISDLSSCNFFIVCVPTPIDENNSPDLIPLQKSCELLGTILKKGDIFVFESTVYPGVTEEFCKPILEQVSGIPSQDFFVGYSPERINPGDKEHTFENILKIVAGEDEETLEKVSEVYGKVVRAGTYKATSIKVAEAAKIIENTQRDLNIALMNELSQIFDKMHIRTSEVLEAAGTKWNFLKFTPGLVGGHCIGVDPYYLTRKAEQLGIHPQVILAGRKINDSMGSYIGQKTVKLLIQQGIQPKGSNVLICGVTFKENVSDFRNSRVPDIQRELQEFGVHVDVCDPLCQKEDVYNEYAIHLISLKDLLERKSFYDGVIIAVPHSEFLPFIKQSLSRILAPHGLIIDVKSQFSFLAREKDYLYWSL